jgi:hypothetical protein
MVIPSLDSNLMQPELASSLDIIMFRCGICSVQRNVSVKNVHLLQKLAAAMLRK